MLCQCPNMSPKKHILATPPPLSLMSLSNSRNLSVLPSAFGAPLPPPNADILCICPPTGSPSSSQIVFVVLDVDEGLVLDEDVLGDAGGVAEVEAVEPLAQLLHRVLPPRHRGQRLEVDLTEGANAIRFVLKNVLDCPNNHGHGVTEFNPRPQQPLTAVLDSRVQGDPAPCSKPPVDIDLKLRFSVRTMY